MPSDAIATGVAARLHIASIAAATVLALASPGRAADACGVDAICGLTNPEDVVRIGASSWALASRLARDPSRPGGFYAVDLQRRRARALAPDLSGPAAAAYADCPGPPAATGLVTHGLDVRLARGGGEVYAVNHGGRQSIEVFALKTGPDGPALAWTGCVVIPPGVSANAVAALPDGFAVTSFGASGEQAAADLLDGKPSGFVMTWSAAQGWARVPDSEVPGDNGVAASPDGQSLYVNGWGDGTLRILSRRSGGPPPVTITLGDFHPDNIHLAPEGQLVIAGQVGERRTIMACDKEPVCPVGSRIVTVDPRSLRVRTLATAPATATFGAASAAVIFNGALWAGSFQGNRLVRLRGDAGRPRD